MKETTTHHPCYRDSVVIEQTVRNGERSNFPWSAEDWAEQKKHSNITVAVFHIHPKNAPATETGNSHARVN